MAPGPPGGTPEPLATMEAVEGTVSYLTHRLTTPAGTR